MGTDSQNYNKQSIQPRDARIVSLIIQSLGVEDYDPKVVHQLLEFAHRKQHTPSLLLSILFKHL
jgi:transcription initiation factor TFIID subunit 9B